MSVLQREDDYVEVVCASINLAHGYTGARLRIFNSGELKNTCECYPAFSEGFISHTNMRARVRTHALIHTHIYCYVLFKFD